MNCFRTDKGTHIWKCGIWLVGSNGKDILLYSTLPHDAIPVDQNHPVGIRNAVDYLQSNYPNGFHHNLLTELYYVKLREFLKIAEQPLRYCYSSYWQTWSRLVAECDGNCVEVNLSPLNGWSSKAGLDDVRGIRVRCHRTPKTPNDIVTDQLPPYLLEEMREHLGAELTQFMLTADFVNLVDWQSYRKANNGGASFYRIAKGVPCV